MLIVLHWQDIHATACIRTAVTLRLSACECVCLSFAAVAFSGGCDSAALLGVAREIFSKGVTAVTVDHRWAGVSCDHHVTNMPADKVSPQVTSREYP